MATKIDQTNVTDRDVTTEQGGVWYGATPRRVWVECPDRYNVDEITAEDIVHDGAIRVLTDREVHEIHMASGNVSRSE
jgi:hypothetical protein